MTTTEIKESKMHVFELIKTTDCQRTYRLPKRCKRFPRCEDISESLLGPCAPKFKPEYERAEDLSEGIDKVVVSDAHTHIERLVFPAFDVRNKETGEVHTAHDSLHIAGELTLMIHGGNPDAVYPDDVYLNQIMMLNP